MAIAELAMKYILLFWLLIPSFTFAENFLINSNKLFDFAEKTYSQFFSPPGIITATLDNYLVRYYPDTGNYIGTQDGNVYVYGNIFNGLLKAGIISDFIELEPDSDELFAKLFTAGQSNVQVYGSGTVVSILSDDLDGNRHQRFILELESKQTLLISHNIDLAPRIETLSINDSVEFYGEYEWNNKGGVIHWTHHDPNGTHQNGWLYHNNRIYQ